MKYACPGECKVEFFEFYPPPSVREDAGLDVEDDAPTLRVGPDGVVWSGDTNGEEVDERLVEEVQVVLDDGDYFPSCPECGEEAVEDA